MTTRTRKHRAAARPFSCIVIGCSIIAGLCGGAQADDGVFDAYARWVVRGGPWKGPTVPFPDPTPRPQGPLLRADSTLAPLHVHAPPDTPPARRQRALQAAEEALRQLRLRGWPLPPPDGGLGSTQGLDVYLVPDVPGAGAGLDGQDLLPHYDGGLTFALVSSHTPTHMILPCVVSAVAQAGLLAADPAEAAALRAAGGALFAWLVAAHFGCSEAVSAAQDSPEAGVGHADAGEAGGLWFSMLSERADGGTGRFFGDMWHFARQRSAGLEDLRASPDLWEAIDRALANADEALDDVAIEFAIARFFAGRRNAEGPAGFEALASLAAEAPVPIRNTASYPQLPVHLYPDPGVRPLGTSYNLVDIPEGVPAAELHVWLRGELGPRWSLSAVQLDAGGREIGRLTAPARKTPRSYLPIMLSPQARSVLLVVTYLPPTLPDADVAAPPPAHFKLIVATRAGHSP